MKRLPTRPYHFLQLLGVSLSIALVASAFAADGDNAGERFAPGSISSSETASDVLAAVVVERTRLQTRYAQEERDCQGQFFVTRCIEQAKERRLRAMSPLDVAELEANRYLRQDRAQQRERALEERRVRSAAKAERAVAATPRLPVAVGKESMEPAQHTKVPQTAAGSERSRRQKPEPSPEQERAAAHQRAENAAAYERKVQAAHARQDAIARHKAEKERRRAQRRVVNQTSSN